MVSLAGKNYLVTGASSGIGEAIAVMISNFGGKVIALGRDEKRLREITLKLKGDGHSFFSFDLTDQEQLKVFINQSPDFDGVIFNAGVIDYTPVKFINDSKISEVFDVNFKSVVCLSQQLIKKNLLKKGASLVFISSISSKLGVPATALYASSKAALSAYAKVIASELATKKIRANIILPGIIITPMTALAHAAISQENMKEAEKLYPLGYGSPEDVGGLVIYLLSDLSRWMTGSELVLDGGLTLK